MPAGTGEHRQLQLFTILHIKKQSVHYRILRSYKDTLHDSNARIPTEFIAASQTNEETDDIAENLDDHEFCGQACAESIPDHKGCKKDPDNVSHFYFSLFL